MKRVHGNRELARRFVADTRCPALQEELRDTGPSAAREQYEVQARYVEW